MNSECPRERTLVNGSALSRGRKLGPRKYIPTPPNQAFIKLAHCLVW